MKTLAPARIRSMEFLEGALAQRDPVRSARLVGRAVAADPGNPHALALLGHFEADLARACALYARLGPDVDGEGRPWRAVRGLARAVEALAGADPHEALALAKGRDMVVPSLLAPGFARVHAAAALSVGDAEESARAIDAYDRLVPGAIETPWFRFVEACRFRGERVQADYEAARALAPTLPDVILDAAVQEVAGNPGCVAPGEAGLKVARAAVLPGLASAPAAVAWLCERA